MYPIAEHWKLHSSIFMMVSFSLSWKLKFGKNYVIPELAQFWWWKRKTINGRFLFIVSLFRQDGIVHCSVFIFSTERKIMKYISVTRRWTCTLSSDTCNKLSFVNLGGEFHSLCLPLCVHVIPVFFINRNKIFHESQLPGTLKYARKRWNTCSCIRSGDLLLQKKSTQATY